MSRTFGSFTESSDYEPDVPEESDLTTEDHIHFYSDGRLVLTVTKHGADFTGRRTTVEEGDVPRAEMWKQIMAWEKRERFFPNVWWISDHGNSHLMRR